MLDKQIITVPKDLVRELLFDFKLPDTSINRENILNNLVVQYIWAYTHEKLLSLNLHEIVNKGDWFSQLKPFQFPEPPRVLSKLHEKPHLEILSLLGLLKNVAVVHPYILKEPNNHNHMLLLQGFLGQIPPRSFGPDHWAKMVKSAEFKERNPFYLHEGEIWCDYMHFMVPVSLIRRLEHCTSPIRILEADLDPITITFFKYDSIELLYPYIDPSRKLPF